MLEMQPVSISGLRQNPYTRNAICAVVLGKLLKPVCLCHQAAYFVAYRLTGVISLARKVTARPVESNGGLYNRVYD